jgi:hypothetical protein
MITMTTGMALALAVIVAALAAVELLLGVALLVFGTPTLLLIGFSFQQVLAYLLPCSITALTASGPRWPWAASAPCDVGIGSGSRTERGTWMGTEAGTGAPPARLCF